MEAVQMVRRRGRRRSKDPTFSERWRRDVLHAVKDGPPKELEYLATELIHRYRTDVEPVIHTLFGDKPLPQGFFIALAEDVLELIDSIADSPRLLDTELIWICMYTHRTFADGSRQPQESR